MSTPLDHSITAATSCMIRHTNEYHQSCEPTHVAFDVLLNRDKMIIQPGHNTEYILKRQISLECVTPKAWWSTSIHWIEWMVITKNRRLDMSEYNILHTSGLKLLTRKCPNYSDNLFCISVRKQIYGVRV
jgi:hypothetical protein